MERNDNIVILLMLIMVELCIIIEYWPGEFIRVQITTKPFFTPESSFFLPSLKCENESKYKLIF